MRKNAGFGGALNNALCGIAQTARREKNFRIQIAAAILAVAGCIVFGVPLLHFAMVVLAIFLVLALELMNTAIEAVVDMVCGENTHPLAKFAKDASAAAVLVGCLFAAVVAVFVAVDIIRGLV